MVPRMRADCRISASLAPSRPSRSPGRHASGDSAPCSGARRARGPSPRGTTVVEITPQRRHQLGRVIEKRPVDPVDQGRAGQRVTGKRPLGEQVVGQRGPRRIAPRACNGESGKRGLRAAGRVDQARNLVSQNEMPRSKPGSRARAMSRKLIVRSAFASSVSATTGAITFSGALPGAGSIAR